MSCKKGLTACHGKRTGCMSCKKGLVAFHGKRTGCMSCKKGLIACHAKGTDCLSCKKGTGCLSCKKDTLNIVLNGTIHISIIHIFETTVLSIHLRSSYRCFKLANMF